MDWRAVQAALATPLLEWRSVRVSDLQYWHRDDARLLLVGLHVARGRRLAALREAWREFLPLGLLGISLSFACFTMAMQFTSVSHAVFIPAMMPLLVLATMCLQGKERLSLSKGVGFALAVSGIVLLELDKTVVAGGAAASLAGAPSR